MGAHNGAATPTTAGADSSAMARHGFGSHVLPGSINTATTVNAPVARLRCTKCASMAAWRPPSECSEGAWK